MGDYDHLEIHRRVTNGSAAPGIFAQPHAPPSRASRRDLRDQPVVHRIVGDPFLVCGNSDAACSNRARRGRLLVVLFSSPLALALGLRPRAGGGGAAGGLPDLAGHRRRPGRPVRLRDRAGRPDLHPRAQREDQDRQERAAAADAVRRPAVRGHRRPRADRDRVRPRLRRLQPLRLLLLHGPRPAEPPGPLQRGRGRRHRRSVRAVQDVVAVPAPARRREHPLRARRQALLRGRRQRRRAATPRT